MSWSRSNSPEAACHGKQRFDSQALAAAVCERPRRKTAHYTPYHCAYCHGWHIGPPRRPLPRGLTNKAKTGGAPRRRELDDVEA